MSIFWQNVVIGAVLAGAVLYLILRYRLRRKRQNPCASCSAIKVAAENRRSVK